MSSIEDNNKEKNKFFAAYDDEAIQEKSTLCLRVLVGD